jgi:hypothetical protein
MTLAATSSKVLPQINRGLYWWYPETLRTRELGHLAMTSEPLSAM